ncbi:hypothetical protein HDF16_005182 [Granulicella aggregans]|uniref:Transposase n=1 Tax=Granulicella aggregans TaxID=474949 RepID=A0A7W7ZJR2_9BACT|nr:hypothetical protein [Granulicella aggregans]
MQIHSVGIDLGKTTFHLVALGDHGRILLKKFTQRQLITFTTNRQLADWNGSLLWGSLSRSCPASHRSKVGDITKVSQSPMAF